MAVRVGGVREYSEGVVRAGGIEPPRAEPTAPSTLRVYHFRHDRKEFPRFALPDMAIG